MTIEVSAYFQHRWSVFWATTYTFELPMFDGFWLPRLGERPLNATVLVDARRLATTWATLPPDEPWRLQRANRQYLIRGVSISRGAFHPKTYFFANAQDGVLLVGSGNLGLRGFEDGYEVFSTFRSSDPAGLAAICGWRYWMQGVVARLDDPQVSTRWLDVLNRSPWLLNTAGASVFVTNWDQPLVAQLTAGLTPPVDELHVLAPFYDRDATALTEIIAATRPRALYLYIGKEVSVDGDQLRMVAQTSDAVLHIAGFTPDEFVHAKLIGVITGSHGRLLSGSANLSQVALLQAALAGGNVEAGVLLDTSADAVRGAFIPFGLELRPLQLDNLAALHFRVSPEAPAPSLTLLSAARLSDGRIAIRMMGTVSAEALSLTDGVKRVQLIDNQTAAPFPLAGDTGLVWLADEHDQRLSNSVPVDDPAQLQGWLQQRGPTTERPRELADPDIDTPIGKMLQRLHDACIFDIDETPAAGRVQRLQDTDADAIFWERLLKEELRLDPRVAAYRSHPGSRRPDDDDEVLTLLRRMLEKIPDQVHLRLTSANKDTRDPDRVGTGMPWTPDRRLQLRLFNVLDRWSRALSDPRLRWINPLAPVRNFAALISTLLECWMEHYLTEDRLLTLIATLFGSFIRTARTPGYLEALEEAERFEAVAVLDDATRSGATALLYAGLRPTAKWRGYVFDWQAFLVPALEAGIVSDDKAAAAVVSLIMGTAVTPKEMGDQLLSAALYMDDQQWGLAAARELNFTKVELTADKFSSEYGVTLSVTGIADPLSDPRLVILISKALEYRKATGAVISLPVGRLSIKVGDKVYAKLEGVSYKSSQDLTWEDIRLLEANGAGLRALLPISAERAA